MIIVGDAFARPLVEALEQAASRGESVDLRSLKMIVSSGVMWSPAVKEQMLEWVDATLFDGVGATEGAMAMQVSRRGQAGKAATFIALADTRLFTEEGREIARESHEPGLIAAGGALLPRGYYKDEKRTAQTFRVIDGKRYAFIGDWGQWNDDGTLRLLGRGSGCINTGGEKVYPEEVEHAIAAHPDVVDCLVVGVPDERFGQRVVALLVARDGRKPAAEMAEFLAHRIAGYKRPRACIEVDRIPRLPNGKPDYREAQALMAQTPA
jgi:fatty-acyl-CoA synthase